MYLITGAKSRTEPEVRMSPSVSLPELDIRTVAEHQIFLRYSHSWPFKSKCSLTKQTSFGDLFVESS